MKTSIDFLCDLWMALYQFSDRDDVEDKAFSALIETMDAIEKTLILKLQDESPNALKILAMITNFGALKPPPIMEPLLKTYEPNFESPIKKVA
ncbi:hypothetical protein [Bartonella tribocorum]|uniref:Hypothetical prophage protein n=1 Tax=Bartonella tribocorum (strain DSM 28219 / CCUG 45778 / CIP 105476 / IBS 506) TaxID=382640 RepID=A9INN1_BART1|nr:hypothetical protein [Bartonella tribocorum]CAK00817.1 hypothetical prophage protein [Bartonella tribocorum CIP 105476]CAK00980.1 hypothetical prophage protein [Bartonella tribocorum CIP 105476]CDO48013.1 hypothetical protein BM1374166_00321 [Bartonella tribocorum]CDO48181.1 hypothetical protein BM1374166_00490 [Bartonella tribocorum]